MLILAIDSTARETAAALLEDGRTIAAASAANLLTGSEALLPLIESLLGATGKTMNEIALYATAVGPGSFTGVRIGVALVKGLAFGRGAPCAPVSTLTALARNLAGLPGVHCPVMDARRGQVYTALFRDGERILPDSALTPAELALEIARLCPGEPVFLAGDGFAVAEPVLRAAGIALGQTPPLLIPHSAVSVGLEGYDLFRAGKTVSDLALAPVYLRPAQPDERENPAK